MGNNSSVLNIDGYVLKQFMQYFAGSETHHGITELGQESAEGEKREAKSHTEKGGAFGEQYGAHLLGKVGLGIAPLITRDSVKFAVIDVDIYDASIRMKIIHAINEAKLPINVALSKSGGLHLYFFFKEPEKAIDVRAALSEIVVIFALDYYGKQFNAAFDKTEIFPKQNLETTQNGSNWINLPYFNYTANERPMLDSEGGPLSILDAFTQIQDNLVTLDELKEALKQLRVSDGPPCLEHIQLFHDLTDGDGRNNYIFSLAKYYKLSDNDDAENELISANAALDKPIPESELRATLNSALKTDASYLCAKSPLNNICNRKLCNARQFGVSNTAVSNFSFGQLTIVMSEPTVYKWIVDDKEFVFYDESEIINQETFRKLAMKKLFKIPRLLKQDTWINTVNRALENKIVEYPEAGLGNSLGELLMAHVTDFLTNRGHAEELALVAQGSVYEDELNSLIYFRMDSLFKHLKNNNVNILSIAQLQVKLSSEFGAVTHRKSTTRTGQFRCWSIPKGKLTPWMRPDMDDIDFHALAERAGEEEDF